VSLGFPNQSTLKLSQDFQHPQQSKVHQLSSTHPAQPKRMDPLLCHAVPQVFHLLLGLQCIWSRISMLGLSGFATVRKIEHRPKHLRHAGINSWLEYTNSIYSQQNHGSSPTICFPFPSQNMNEERRVGERMSGERTK
jgi:hypothetical protein